MMGSARLLWMDGVRKSIAVAKLSDPDTAKVECHTSDWSRRLVIASYYYTIEYASVLL